MTYYIDNRMPGIGEKAILVIVDEDRNIVHKNPTKDELKGLKTFPKEKYNNKRRRYYTDEQLLSYLIQFYEKYGRPPTEEDFQNNSEYPGLSTYQRRFGSWSNALKLVGLDIDSMVKKGIIETDDQKARFAEIIVRDHFKQHPIDLAGENKLSSYDGICPNRKTYDVKGSGLSFNGRYYYFRIGNKYKDDIEIYYFLAFNEDWTKLKYAWRVPGEIIESDNFCIGLDHSYEFNIDNMKEYNITDIIRHVLDIADSLIK